ncbi:hypothetical protein T10_1722 [Trichinella papuae]|uniref:Transmembrane protein n=1 Tax=Trichinella papuae TaxID=268474 RepID=A0A0V1MXK2_9BILA|nr:hypothetical protein T10_1722 [Trichinella papuae]
MVKFHFSLGAVESFRLGKNGINRQWWWDVVLFVVSIFESFHLCLLKRSTRCTRYPHSPSRARFSTLVSNLPMKLNLSTFYHSNQPSLHPPCLFSFIPRLKFQSETVKITV